MGALCQGKGKGAAGRGSRSAAPSEMGPKRKHHGKDGRVQASVRVKVNWVTPSSLVTVMFVPAGPARREPLELKSLGRNESALRQIPPSAAGFTARSAAPSEMGPKRKHHGKDGCVQASVRVKVNWVTPSSLVTVMFSFRLPRMVLTIYSPRPTPSRSMERE